MHVFNAFALLSDETHFIDQDGDGLKEGDLVIAFYDNRWIVGTFSYIDGNKAMVGRFMDEFEAFAFWGPIRKMA